MQTIGEREPLHGELGRFYDAIENPRKTRGELPILRDAELRSYLADVRERTLEVLDEVEIGPEAEDPLLREGFVYEMLLAHEHQHNETMLQLLQMVDGYEPVRRSTLGRPRAGRRRARDGRVDGRRVRDRRPAAGFAYDNERPRHAVELARLRDRSHPGRPTAPTSRSWRRPAPSRRCTGSATARRLGAAPRWAARPDRPGPSRRPRLLARGRRLRPLGRQAAAERARVGGRAARVCDGVGQVWEWTSSDFLAYPGFEAFPYREYSEVFFGDELQGAARRLVGDRIPTSIRPSFRNWDLPQRRQIFAGLRCARDADDRDRASTSTPTRRRRWRATSAAGLTAEPKELAPKYFYDERGSQLFEQITELPEYYPTRAEREILADRARPRSSPRLARRARWSSSARARRRRPATCSSAMRDAGCLRDLRPGRHLRGDHPRDRRVLVEEYPGLAVRGLVCDFEHHLERIPDGDGGRLIAFLGGTDRQPLPEPARRVPRPDRGPAGARRPAPARHRPGQGRRAPRGRLRRRRRRHRRVQQERARRC